MGTSVHGCWFGAPKDSLRFESRFEETRRMKLTSEQCFATGVGLLCHIAFAVAVASMAISVYFGLHFGVGHLRGISAVCADLALIIQFPLIHSWLLTKSGRRVLGFLSPPSLSKEMITTWFALIASIQLCGTFLLWSPLAELTVQPHGVLRTLSDVVYLFSWIFLAKAMADADLSLQSGAKGWVSVLRGKKPKFQPFPQKGTFAVCRQPIYLAFSLVLWSAPVWTVDRALLAIFWTAYCVWGPLLKEKRFSQLYGRTFTDYQKEMSYFLPLGKKISQRRARHRS